MSLNKPFISTLITLDAALDCHRYWIEASNMRGLGPHKHASRKSNIDVAYRELTLKHVWFVVFYVSLMCLKSIMPTRLEQNTWNCACMRYWNIFKIRMTFFDWMRELFTPPKWRSWQRFPNMSHSNPSPLCITSTVHKAILYVHGSPPGSPSALKGAGQISQLMYNMSQSVEKLLLLHMKF